MPRGKQVFGPPQVDTQIQNTPDIAERLTLLNQSGSEVIQGTLQIRGSCCRDSILYVHPRCRVQPAELPTRFMGVFYSGRELSSLQAALAELLTTLTGVTPTQPPGTRRFLELLPRQRHVAGGEARASIRADLGQGVRRSAGGTMRAGDLAGRPACGQPRWAS